MTKSTVSATEPWRTKGHRWRLSWTVAAIVLLTSIWIGVLTRNFRTSTSTLTANHHSIIVQGWKRIRLRTDDDVEASLGAIADIIAHPEHAELLEELIFDRTPRLYGSAWCFDSDGDDEAGRFTDEGLLPLNKKWSAWDRRIEEAVHKANLPSALKPQITRAVVWKSQHRNPEISGTAKASNWMYRREAEHHQFALAAFTLLAAMASNLKAISTVEPSGVASSLFQAANRNRTTAPALTKLRTVKLLTGDDIILNDERFYSKMSLFSSIRYFDHLPSIHSISSQTIELEDEPQHIPPGLSPIKSISITNSALASTAMCTLIRLSDRLESVTFGSGGRCILGGYTMSIYSKSLGKCLEQHRATLHTVDLDLDQYLWSSPSGSESIEEEDGRNRYSGRDDDEDDEDDDDLPHDPDWTADQTESIARGYVSRSCDLPDTKPYGETIGSFSDFHELHTLRIGIKMLLGSEHYGSETARNTWPVGLIEMMPLSLRVLEVRGYVKGFDKAWDAEVDRFLQLQPQRLPNLTSIKGLLQHIPSGQDVEDPDNETGDLYVVPDEDDGWLRA